MQFVLKVKSLKGFKDFFSYSRSKKILYNQLFKDRKILYQRKILKYLSIYSLYRQKNKTRDKLITSQVLKIRKKYTLSKWYQRALLFSSTRYFEKLFNSLQKKEVIFSINKYIEIQKLTTKYIHIYREEALLKTIITL